MGNFIHEIGKTVGTFVTNVAQQTQTYNNRTQSQILEIKANGRIDAFEQGDQGDCYLLAALTSISANKKASEILKKNIKKNQDGSVTITFPGAKIFNKNSSIQDYKLPESYTITKEEFAIARASEKYSTGDDDVLLYELAFEKYRKYVNNFENPLTMIMSFMPQSGTYTGDTKDAPLDGGCGNDVIFMLTGYTGSCYILNYNAGHYFPKSPRTERIQQPTEQDSPLIHANPQNDTEEQQTTNTDSQNSGIKNLLSGLYHLFDRNTNKNNLTDIPINKTELQEELDAIRNHPERYIVTVGVEYRDGYHELSLKEFRGNNVVLVNPWDSTEEVILSLNEFKDKIVTLDISNILSNPFEPAKELIQNININFDEISSNIYTKAIAPAFGNIFSQTQPSN